MNASSVCFSKFRALWFVSSLGNSCVYLSSSQAYEGRRVVCSWPLLRLGNEYKIWVWNMNMKYITQCVLFHACLRSAMKVLENPLNKPEKYMCTYRQTVTFFRVLHFSCLFCVLWGQGTHTCPTACKERAEGNLPESVLSFLHGGPGTWTQLSVLGAGHHYPLSHLSSPRWSFNIYNKSKENGNCPGVYTSIQAKVNNSLL